MTESRMNTGENGAGSKQYVELTGGEVLTSAASRVCAYCGGAKLVSQPFCATDLAALPLYLRNWLARGAGDSYFVTNFRRALQHLVDLGPQRRARFGRIGRWPHFSEDDLRNAGFRFLNHDVCRVPNCKQRIVWYRTPHGARMPVNLADYQPHSNTCVDPEYFARQRELKTSARRNHRRRA